MGQYLIVSTILFGFLGLIWQREDIVNLCIKIFLLSLMAFGAFYSLEYHGYLIKTDTVVENTSNTK